ncbi:MAG: hypothetical protein J1F35_08865 [Erysipelotrichales bacterium]|nr:hypothetical protein [Erysipelotrichales bacterium]
MKTEAYKTINNYFMFMWNKFDLEMSKQLFGENLGIHIWNKYSKCMEKSWQGSPAELWSVLDKENCQILIEASEEAYN